MLTVAVPKRNKLPNIIVLTPKDGRDVEEDTGEDRASRTGQDRVRAGGRSKIPLDERTVLLL